MIIIHDIQDKDIVIPRLHEKSVFPKNGKSIQITLTIQCTKVNFAHVRQDTRQVLYYDSSIGSMEIDKKFEYGKAMYRTDYLKSLRRFSLDDNFTVTVYKGQGQCDMYKPGIVAWNTCMEWWKYVCKNYDEVDLN